MMDARHQGGLVIASSFAAALVLTVLPLPDAIVVLRPEWTALVLIYWCMAVPQRIGVGIGWGVGLLMDVLRAGLMGQHALSFGIIAYVTHHLYQRLRVFPLWQQAFSILALIALHEVLMLWIRGIAGHAGPGWNYWLPALSSALVWPPLFILLRGLRRRFKVA